MRQVAQTIIKKFSIKSLTRKEKAYQSQGFSIQFIKHYKTKYSKKSTQGIPGDGNPEEQENRPSNLPQLERSELLLSWKASVTPLFVPLVPSLGKQSQIQASPS